MNINIIPASKKNDRIQINSATNQSSAAKTDIKEKVFSYADAGIYTCDF